MSGCDTTTTGDGARPGRRIDLDALPNEILHLIIAHHLLPQWRFMARRVCARWRDLLDRAVNAEWVDSRGVPYAVRWHRVPMPLKTDSVALTRQWHKGAIVMASAAAQCIRNESTRWVERPHLLVDRCIKEWGAPRHCVPAVLVASQDVALIHHAMVVADTLPFQPPNKWNVRGADFDGAFLCKPTTRTIFDACLVAAAVHTGDVESVKFLVSLVRPSFDWSRVDSLHWLAMCFEKERLDTALFVLSSWVATLQCYGHTDARFGLLLSLWKTLGSLPFSHVECLLSLARCGSDCHTDGDNDGDDTHTAMDPGKHGSGGRGLPGASGRREVVARTSPKREAIDGLGMSDDNGSLGGTVSMGPITDGTAKDAVGRCLARSWQYGGAAACASVAARNGNTDVLALACASLTSQEARSAAAKACRCGHVDTVKWCVTVARLLTAAEAAHRAAEPYQPTEVHYRAGDPAGVLAWAFDPQGGAYTPSRDDAATMIRTSLYDGSTERSVWIAQRHPDKVSAHDVSQIVGMVCRQTTTSVYGPMGDVERIVCMVDDIASVNPHACIGCDVWGDIWSGQGRCQGDRLRLLRYAWARAKGIDACVAARILDKDVPRAPAPSSAWARWCRVRSTTTGLAHVDPETEEHAIRAWFASRGLTVADGLPAE